MLRHVNLGNHGDRGENQSGNKQRLWEMKDGLNQDTLFGEKSRLDMVFLSGAMG